MAREGVNEAQLFCYVPSKATLCREAMFDALNAHLADFRAAKFPFAAGDRDPADRYVRAPLGFLRKNRQLLVALLSSQPLRAVRRTARSPPCRTISTPEWQRGLDAWATPIIAWPYACPLPLRSALWSFATGCFRRTWPLTTPSRAHSRTSS